MYENETVSIAPAIYEALTYYGTKPGHFETLKIHFPTSERCERTSEWTNEWFVCSRPQCAGLHVPEEQDELLVVLIGDVDSGDFGQTFEGNVSKHGHGQEFVDERGDEFGFEDVAQRDPVQEAQQRLQRRHGQAGIVRIIHHVLAQLENGGKFVAHAIFQVFGFGLRHLPRREVEDLRAGVISKGGTRKKGRRESGLNA